MKTSRLSLLFILALTACPQKPEPVPPPPPAVVTSFTADPKVVTGGGGMVTLTWATQDAKRVAIEHVGKGPVSIDGTMASGSVTVMVTGDATFVLTARGDGGTDSAVQSVTLMGSTGGFVFDASPKRINAGESTTLVWNVPGATTVSIRQQGGSALDLRGQTASGSLVVTPSADTRYELTSGSITGNVDVVVVPRIVSFTATPSPAPGQPVTLSWEVAGGGTRVTVKRDGAAMPLFTDTSSGIVARGQHIDTPPSLRAEGLYVYRLEVEHGGQTYTASVEVRIAGNLAVSAFNAPAYVRPGQQFNVSWRTSGATSLTLFVDDVPVYVAPSQLEANGLTLPLPGVDAGSRRVKLVIRNDRGGEVVRERTVSAVEPPVFVSFTSDKTNIAAAGEAVVLTWNVTNAREVYIEQEGVGPVHFASGAIDMGSVTVFPNRATSVYTLRASNGTGEKVAAANVTVTVGSVARLTFAGPAAVGQDAGVTGHTVPGGLEVHGLPNVVKNQTGEAFVDISGSNELFTTDPDNISNMNALGEIFTTRIFGRRVSYQNVVVSPNGWLTIDDRFLTSEPTGTAPIGTSLLATTLAPYFRDLRLVPNVSRIWGRLDGAGDSRRLIVQWTEVEDKAAPGSRLTFQAQVYSSGKVVFAYSQLEGIGTPAGDIGIVNGSNTAVLAPAGPPAVGDTFTFFGPTPLPTTVKIENAPYVARVAVPGGFVEVEGDARFWLQITEANPRPAAGVTNGEWLEVTNTTSSPLDLNGYTLNFGGSNNHVINGSVVVPPNGRVVLAQAMDLGDATAVRFAAYVYPTTLTMPDTSGSVSLVINGGTYSSLAWTSTSAPAAGASVSADVQTAEGAYAGSIVCPSTTATYGAQTGTPGAPNQPKCFPYTLTRIPGAFESIAMTAGDAGTITRAAVNNEVFTLAQPIPYYGATAPNITVSANGWVTPVTTTTTAFTTKLVPSTTVPAASIAPFMVDLKTVVRADSGIFRQTKDPDGMPASGDEYTIISWENFHFNVAAFETHRFDFQVKFFANGNIEYHYGTLSSPGRDFERGSFGTIWLEDRTSRGALVANLYSSVPGLATETAYRFAYTP